MGAAKKLSKMEIINSREFIMTPSNYKDIQGLAYALTGISLSMHKENMIYGRLARRLRALGLQNFDQYCQLLSQDKSTERHEFVNAITTNLTSFFREKHHFDFLKSKLIPHIIKTFGAKKKIRIWSAGCSTGEEPYSIAMVIRECSALADWDVKILATDLDSNVVAAGRRGIYKIERGDKVPQEFSRFISLNEASEQIRMKSSIRDMITFNQLNLLKPWPMKGQFDIIFCRNVVIYFDAKTQGVLFDRYAGVLSKGGHLFIGHSENLAKVCDKFEALGNTIYKLP